VTQAGVVRRKRHPIRTTIIVLVIIAALVGSGYYVANMLAGTFAKQFVQAGVSQELGGTGKVTADLGKGSVLLQVIKKRITTLHVTIDGFTSGTLTGSAVFDADGVPLNTSDPVDSLSIVLSVPASGLAPLVGTKAGETATVTLVGSDIQVADTEKIAGKKTPVSIDYVPSTSGTTLILTPEKITIGTKAYTPAKLKASPYGAVLKPLLAAREKCLADGLPSKLSLKSVTVVGQDLVVTATGTSVSLGSLSTKGTCPAG
jgi:hypothetical protein